jgi:tetratricopeptide (TPR) repeat protein
MLSSAHQPDRAILLLQKVIELDPTFAEAHRNLAITYVNKGQASQAIAEARRGLELDQSDFEQATLGYVYAVAGKPEQARKVLAELSKRPAVSPVYLSFIYVGLGRNDQAFACLENAYSERSLLVYALAGPEAMVDPIRSDPRFQDLLRRVTEPRGNIELKNDVPKS